MTGGNDAANRRALLVLGMHRSGTSLLAGLLVRLGVEGPRTLMPPDASNPLGYWESERILEFHDRLLRAAGTSWDAWTPIDTSLSATTPVAEELHRLIAAEFGAPPLFVVKDPRLCRLVPFWSRALEGAGISAAAILVLRDPVEVARSLEVRDGLPARFSLLMWLRHALDAESATRSLPRSIVGYREVLSDWRAVSDRMATDLAIRWPLAPDAADGGMRLFVRSDLCHHDSSRENLDPSPPLGRWVTSAREAFERLRHPDTGTRARAYAVLDEIRTALDAASAAFGRGDEVVRGRVARQLDDAEADRRTLRTHAAKVQAAADLVRSQVAALEAERDALQARVDTLQHHAANLEGELGRVHREAAALQSERDALQSERDALREEAGHLRTVQEALRAEGDAAAHHVEALLSSASWRITAPLRALLDLFQRVIGRGSHRTRR
jgi:hypothetical protein